MNGQLLQWKEVISRVTQQSVLFVSDLKLRASSQGHTQGVWHGGAPPGPPTPLPLQPPQRFPALV